MMDGKGAGLRVKFNGENSGRRELDGKLSGKLPLRDIKAIEGGIPTGIEMVIKTSRIPDEVLEEIFPKKLKRCLASERVYTQLKQMILAGKLKKRKRLLREEIAQNFNVSEMVVSKVFSQLKQDGLVIIKGGVGSFVA